MLSSLLHSIVVFKAVDRVDQLDSIVNDINRLHKIS
jgi:hypothetical protein